MRLSSMRGPTRSPSVVSLLAAVSLRWCSSLREMPTCLSGLVRPISYT